MKIEAKARLEAASIQERVEKHNKLVQNKGWEAVQKMIGKNPDVFKTAPKGYAFSVSHKLVKKD